MTFHILGIGIGSFILIVLWLSVIISYIISIRTETSVYTIVLGFTLVVTFFIVLFPKGEDYSQIDNSQIFDQFFIWRNIIAAFVGFSSIATILVIILQYWTEPIEIKPIF